MLQAPENRIRLPEEMAQEQENRSFLELIDLMVQEEYRSQQNRETDLTVQSAMRSGHLTSYFTPDRIVTPARVMRNGHLKSVWFKQAEYLGLQEPAILNFFFGRPPNEDAEPFIHEQEKEVWDLLNRLNLQPHLWTSSGKLTIFAARPSRLRYLPGDISGEGQESASGLVFNPGADPGKIAKRLRCFSGAPGVFFDDRISRFPQLHLGGDMNYRVGLRNSGTVGDGGGCCRESVAREILRASGAPLWGDIIAFQIVVLACDYSFKGLINITPDELWEDPSIDFLIDQESVNHQVHSTEATIGKIMPNRHKPNKRYFYVEPLNHGETVGEITDPQELADQVMVIAERIDRENWDGAIEAWRRNGNAPGESDPWWLRPHAEEWEAASHIQQAALREEEEFNGLIYAYEASGKSPFSLTAVTNMLTEGIPNSWEAHLSRSRKKAYDWGQVQGEKPTMSGIMISGETVLLMDPKYAGVPYPKRGYIRLIWHPRKEDQLIGVGLSRKDTIELRDALDGMDVDGDKVQLIPMTDERNRPVAEILRLPSSPDGGACLRLTLADAARLREVGYHFNRRTGERRFPDLYRIVDGQQVYPDVLHATPHENPPVWTTDPDLMVRRTAELNQFHGYMGKVFLALENLSYADQYDPALHKFSVSEEIIDASLNGSKDPASVYQPLQLANVMLVEQGIPVDRCIFPRIQSGVRQLFEERNPGEEFEPIMRCKHHHQVWGKAQEGANSFQRGRSKSRALMAHGPAEWLTVRFRTKLYNIVVRALEERMKVWAQKSAAEKETWALEESTRNQKEAVIAGLIQDAKDSERSIVLEAYLKAVKTVGDLEPGQFIAAWMQAAISRNKRLKRFDPVCTNAIIKLPTTELYGFLSRGPSLATAIVRADEPGELIEGERCFIEADGEGRDREYWLISKKGEAITQVRTEARNYLDLDLEVIGPMPRITPTLRKETGWEQAQNQVAFRVLNPQDV